MPLSHIVTTDDIDVFFGVCCDEGDSKDAQLLMQLRKWKENQARRYARWQITQNTFTEYHRRDDVGQGDFSDLIDVQGDTAYLRGRPTSDGHILQLDNIFVTAVGDLREDPEAYFDQGSGDFAADTQLTEGTHFVPEYDDGTFCKSGRILRINRDWSSSPGTIKATYTSGFTAAQLNDEYSFIKEAVLEDMQLAFSRVRQQRSGGGGPLKKVRYEGDVTYEYAVDSRTSDVFQLSRSSKSKLQTIRKMSP